MAETDAKASSASSTAAKPEKPPKPLNPVWRMMGLPNIRLRLPSRNWLIFLSITGSWTAAVLYDRRERKRIQRKWTRVVEHIAQEPLETQQLPRKLTVYISAPPSDGIVYAREHFNEYVKPILVAAALDWDAVEGRKEGDVRAGLAERIRRLRRKRGEQGEVEVELDDKEVEALAVEATRERAGVREWSGPGGDVVVGRNTWKEYVRGLHEGWLGPLDGPKQEEVVEASKELSQPTTEASSSPTSGNTTDTPTATTDDDASPTASLETAKPEEEKKAEEDEKKPKKKTQKPPYITTSGYQNATIPSTCPQALGPAAVVPTPHLLGFFNFPIRMYRFLNRRRIAEDVGRETAAAVLGVYRPFEATSGAEASGADVAHLHGEQQSLLAHEEGNWHKNVFKRDENDTKERVWLDDMVLDPRVADRMRRFVLEAEVEERARNLQPEQKSSWFSGLWAKKEKQMWEGLSDD